MSRRNAANWAKVSTRFRSAERELQQFVVYLQQLFVSIERSFTFVCATPGGGQRDLAVAGKPQQMPGRSGRGGTTPTEGSVVPPTGGGRAEPPDRVSRRDHPRLHGSLRRKRHRAGSPSRLGPCFRRCVSQPDGEGTPECPDSPCCWLPVCRHLPTPTRHRVLPPHERRRAAGCRNARPGRWCRCAPA